jgi:hypothetical protein
MRNGLSYLWIMLRNHLLGEQESASRTKLNRFNNVRRITLERAVLAPVDPLQDRQNLEIQKKLVFRLQTGEEKSRTHIVETPASIADASVSMHCAPIRKAKRRTTGVYWPLLL